MLRVQPLRVRALCVQGPLLFGLLDQFGSERVQGVLAISPCFRHPCRVFFLFLACGSGGGKFQKLLLEIERLQFVLALP